MVVQSTQAERRSPVAPLGWLFRWLPALIAGMLCLHAGELIAAKASPDLLLPALRNDLFGFMRYVWVPALLALPFLFLQSDRAKMLNVGVAWSFLLALQALLIEYHASTGVPLGADLFAYSLNEVLLTAGGSAVRAAGVATLALALALMWTVLALTARRQQRYPSTSSLVIGMLFMLLAIFLARPQDSGDGKHQSSLALNKGAYFVENTMQSLRQGGGGVVLDEAAPAQVLLDPAHPFLRTENTPDTLGPVFTAPAGKPPNFVFILVEGLGRSFSGPGARLGSFTPFLDELASKSLYFENFLATQGRTFGVMPSIFGSLPFANNGYSALGKDMPEHFALTTLLKKNGYALRFYTGSNLDFDNQGLYLRRAGVEAQVSERDFKPGLKKSSEWGYADRELVDLVLAREAAAPEPFATVIQTNSMHMPFEFPDKQRYAGLVDTHLGKLGLAADKRARYQDLRQIYASILYTDDALRHYFQAASSLPGYANTIFIITGDHRLPEIPMENRLERYHVPLIIFSPLLKTPLSVKSVSSHFDIAPSIAALLANQHKMRMPEKVTWLGTGLDLEPSFRNLHVLPIKQTKTELSDFVSGTAYLGQDKLYTIADGMEITPLDSAGAREQVRRQFAAFTSANNTLARTGKLLPAAALTATRPFDPARRSLVTLQAATQSGELYASGTRVLHYAGGEVRVTSKFANRAKAPSPTFVPLMVLTDEKGNELREAYGKAQTLAAGAGADVELVMTGLKLAPGKYFVSLIPSHPENGKPVGTGQYHVAIQP